MDKKTPMEMEAAKDPQLGDNFFELRSKLAYQQGFPSSGACRRQTSIFSGGTTEGKRKLNEVRL